MRASIAAFVVLAALLALACRDVSPTPPFGCEPLDCGGGTSSSSDSSSDGGDGGASN